jgi:hypothetical protein
VSQWWRQAGPASEAGVSPDRVLVEEYRRINRDWTDHGRAHDAAACHAAIHALGADARPTALCLSGGGIRSATFGLGVLQAFARSGRLERFDYLSTVSGGGYIGSWLIAWLRAEQGRWSEVRQRLADGVAPQPAAGASAPAAEPLAGLRAYSNYLSPVWGVSADTMSLAAIFLRNLLLNLLVWLPLLAAVVLLPRLYIAALLLDPGPEAVSLATAIGCLGVILAIAYTTADLPTPRHDGRHPVPHQAADPPCSDQFVRWAFAPLLVAAVALGLAGAWYGHLGSGSLPRFLLTGVAVHLLGILAGVLWRRRRGLPVRRAGANLVGGALVAGIGALGGLLAWAVVRRPVALPDRDGTDPLFYALLVVPALLGCFWLAMAVHAGAMRRSTGEAEREWWARATGGWLFASAAWLLLFGLSVHLPLWLFDRFGASLPDGSQLGLGGVGLGLATALAGYWSSNGASLKRRADSLLRAVGWRLLDAMAAALVVVLALGLSLAAGAALEGCSNKPSLHRLCPTPLRAQADHLRQQAALDRIGTTPAGSPAVRHGEGQAFEQVLLHSDVRSLASMLLLMLGTAVLVSWLIGANTFSLHGMYGNRLVRAYLGATRRVRRPHWFTQFDPDDNLPLDDGPSGEPRVADAAPVRPFHVINIALNLVAPSARNLARQQRKAASFTASPLHCGSAELGYVRSRAYGGPQGMSLGRALTISGAAASPNMGYHSSPLVTFAMALFNVRLGWWLPNPAPQHATAWRQEEPPLPFAAMLSEALGRTTDDRASVYLSDGGHFENLGLYEMVRRRCHRVVVVDATCDPGFDYADLHDAVRKIRVDLGIPVDLPPVLPGPGRAASHPRFVVGRIRYSARDGIDPQQDGWLYLIKPRLLPEDPLPQLAHYAAGAGGGDSPFPHQSTADQFFDETQFEAYRLLGMLSAEACFPPELDFPLTGAGRIGWPVGPPPVSALAATGAGVEAARPPCCEPPPAGGLWQGLQKLGGGTALASALTVGGTLGVAGTLALAPGEVRLSAEDRALLKDGLNLKLGSGELRFDAADRELLARGLRVDAGELKALTVPAREALAALADSADKLAAAAERLRAAGPDTALADAVRQLRDEVARLRTASDAAPLLARVTTIQALVQKIEQAGPPRSELDLTPLREDIRAVTKALTDLRTSVEATGPRRNVRGQEGVAR